jgi:hypothetical protein
MNRSRNYLFFIVTMFVIVACMLIGCSTAPGPSAPTPSQPQIPQDEAAPPPALPSIDKPAPEPEQVIAPPSIRLPSERVGASHHWLSGSASEYDLKLSETGTGFDIGDGIYQGWCIEDNFQGNAGRVQLYSSYDTALPDDIKFYRDPTIPKNAVNEPVPWDKLNYLINNKQGDTKDIGAAIFLLMWGKTASFPASTAAQTMYSDAEEKGAGFVPVSGQIMAIVLYQDGLGDDKLPDDRNRKYQDTIIEYIIP